MSQSLLEQLQSRLDPAAIQQIATAVGIPSDKAQAAVNLAVPTLVTALAGNASSESGASSLASALQQHSENPGLSNIVGMLGQASNSGVGQAILGHVLGGKQAEAQEQLSAAAGLQPQQMGQIFAMLAPIVMGVLGQQTKSGGGGLNIGSLMQMMQKEGAAAQKSGAGDAVGSLLGGLLGGAGGKQGGGVQGALAQQGLKALGGLLNRNK